MESETTGGGNSNNDNSDSSVIGQAKDLRQQGNHLFRQQHEHEAALGFYTKALELLENDQNSDCGSRNVAEESILNYCNRSACFFVMEKFEDAKIDAKKAWLDLSKCTSAKAAYRFCKALIALKDYTGAKETIDDHILSQHAKISLSEEERKSFQDLSSQISKSLSSSIDQEQETSICFANRPVSIREFLQHKELGYGNFSEICVVTHKITKERFALKKISKKQAADLAKRQHPNVYNEIQMERRVLLERLPPTCPFVIRMYHAFQDYEHLYYLMELHEVWPDLWSHLRWKEKGHVMVGCHRSQAKFWVYQLVLALEHLHRHGIVHRDIKAENILLNEKGHLVLIDFGTAKDLILTDLNGPEFVGTPDFMSPEAVTGDDSKSLQKLKKDKNKKHLGSALWTADLWALGALTYILQTGVTPFWTTSPYLAFLRIQRALLTRHMGIIHDDCWDFIQKLMKIHPEHRLGADTFQLVENAGPDSDATSPQSKIQECSDGYVDLKEHPYLAAIHKEYTTNPNFREQSPIPTLRDLCYRAVATMAMRDCQDIDLCEAHPPGDGSSHDLMRLLSSPSDRNAVLHLLDRQQLLRQEPRLWGRFFTSPIEARLLAKIRPRTRDVVGLTQMNDDQGKAPQIPDDQQFDLKNRKVELLEFVQICSPLFYDATMSNNTAKSQIDVDSQRKQHVKVLKKCIARINKVRPKLVVVVSAVTLDESIKKLLARINESIPVVLHEAKGNDPSFFTFWLSGIQGICLSHQLATASRDRADDSELNPSGPESTLRPLKQQREQWDWLREQLELVRMSKHPLFCFVNGPPLQEEGCLPLLLLKKLARGRTLALFSPAASNHNDKTKAKLWYRANETVPKGSFWSSKPVTDCQASDYGTKAGIEESTNDDEDNLSVKSTDSDEDESDDFGMVVESSASIDTGLRWVCVDPIHADEWSYDMELFNLDST